MNIACVFPGQGSQSVGMLTELSVAFPVVRETFEELSDTLGVDYWEMAQNGPREALDSTENTQPVMLAAGVAVWRAWDDNRGCRPLVMAGHSFGEYAALVCAGALQFAPAARLAQTRGRLMQTAVAEGEGAMAAILGLQDRVVIELCAQAARDEVVAAVNFNSPGQVVIAGHATAVKRAMALASEVRAKRVLPLAVSVPAHCRLMEPAARELAKHLAQTPFTRPCIPVLHNADVASYEDPADIMDALTRQLYSPVRWSETIREMAGEGAEAIFELGPGKVLTGLNKRIDRTLRGVCVQDPISLENALKLCEEAA